MSETIEIDLLKHQFEFITSPHQIVLLDGGFGAGKTEPLCEWALSECDAYPKNLILLGREEYEDLRDSTLKSFFDVLDKCELPRGFNEQKRTYTHPNGSEIMFRHLSEPAGLKNLNLGAVGIDQGEESKPESFDLLLGRLRRPNSSRKFRITSNPNGHDWIWQLFYGPDAVIWESKNIQESATISPDARSDYKVIRCTSMDNPYLPDGYIARMLSDYPPEFIQQYVYGSREVMLGYRFFDPAALKQQIVQEPLAEGYFVDGLPKPEWRDQKGGAIRIFERYDEHDPYVIGVDIATGEGTSRCAGVCRNARMNRVAAVIDADIRPDELAVQAWLMSRYFGNCVIAPERNGIGFSVVIALQQLTSNIFNGQINEFGVAANTQHIGWWTDARSRMELFSQLQREIAHRSIELKDKELIEQCKAVSMIKGKPKAEDGFRDDLVVACGIAGIVRKIRSSLMEQRVTPQPEMVYASHQEMGKVYGFGRNSLKVAGR